MTTQEYRKLKEGDKIAHHMHPNTICVIEGKENTAKNLATKLLRYTPVADREVKRRYDSIDEAGTEIIIIAGYEKGDFWTTNEYEEYVKQSNTWKDAR